jgi:hypothetical protein
VLFLTPSLFRWPWEQKRRQYAGGGKPASISKLPLPSPPPPQPCGLHPRPSVGGAAQCHTSSPRGRMRMTVASWEAAASEEGEPGCTFLIPRPDDQGRNKVSSRQHPPFSIVVALPLKSSLLICAPYISPKHSTGATGAELTWKRM